MTETSSQYFPTFVEPQGYRWMPGGELLVETSLAGTEQREVDFEWREFVFRAAAMTQDELNNMEFFLKNYAMSGWLPFNFFDFKEEHFVVPEFIGTADGTANLQIPFKETTTPGAVYANGVLLTSWGHTAGYGPGGEGRIIGMNPVPTLGQTMVASGFYGRKRYVVRLQGGQIAGDLFMDGMAFDIASGKYLSNYEFHLKELL